MYCPQMKLGASHKNKIVLEKEKISKMHRLEIDTSYGYRVFIICAKMHNACAFGAFLHIFAKIVAFLKKFLFLKLSYFCDKHLISFEDNTISQIFIFHTALMSAGIQFSFLSYSLNIFHILYHDLLDQRA